METNRVRAGWQGVALCVAIGLGGCASHATQDHAESKMQFTGLEVTEHRGSDDLLTAGLGIDGLRAMTPPTFADPAAPTQAELRRRAIWNNWRGIADLGPLGGYGTLYGSTAAVPGREYAAGASADTPPDRVLVQVPDAFDQEKRCIVVTASSGSRGIYGAIAGRRGVGPAEGLRGGVHRQGCGAPITSTTGLQAWK
jgi:hydroxybutyrate-dimer hydrolase